jgi:hypothetical protein
MSVLEGRDGVYADALQDLLKAISSFRSPIRVIPISAKYFQGFGEVFDSLNEAWCSCGDMT